MEKRSNIGAQRPPFWDLFWGSAAVGACAGLASGFSGLLIFGLVVVAVGGDQDSGLVLLPVFAIIAGLVGTVTGAVSAMLISVGLWIVGAVHTIPSVFPVVAAILAALAMNFWASDLSALWQTLVAALTSALGAYVAHRSVRGIGMS